jgi:hypothetical protein
MGTSHFITDPSDPFWSFSDAAMHRMCFLNWPLRDSFITRYNQMMGTITWGNGTYHHMQPDGRIISKRYEDA